ncbi:uncharacterized protein OCT59_013487 [Rhizophagus irregularis]|nr:hypothetical protein RirG_031200 [Rhizophagus irregularis DAOM 197198w]UZO21084.1 hypothetical protein OCT59_013487 [Rhizophagus irregularis]
MAFSKNTDSPKKVQDTTFINLLDENDHSLPPFETQRQNQLSPFETQRQNQLSPFETQRQNQLSSYEEYEDSDKESLTSDEHDEKKSRSDVATIGSNEPENNQQEFDDYENSTTSSSTSSSPSSLMESALPQYKQVTVCALENCHNQIDFTINNTYDGLIHDIDTRKENVHKNKSEENDSNKSGDTIDHQVERSCSKSVPVIDELKKDDEKDSLEKENFQPIILSRESRKEIELKMEDHKNNVENITHDFHNLSKSFESLGQKYDETIRESIDQEQQVEDVKSKMEFLSNVTNDISKKALETQNNVKDLQEIMAKVPNFENSFKSINEEIRKNEEGMITKFDKQNEKFNDEIRNILSKYYELEKKLKFVDESMKKLRENEMVEHFDLKSKELVSKILIAQTKSGELEHKTKDLEISLNNKFEELGHKFNELEVSLNCKFEEFEHKINAISKSDSLITLLEETKVELQTLFKKEIIENEKNILNRLEEDRNKKLDLMISTVEEEAGKIYGRLETVESYYEILKREFKECDAEIMRRLEEDNVTSDQIIRDKISEAIELYTRGNDAKVDQRIREAIESYEAKVNKLADTSFELEATFSEEIQKTAEKRTRVMEEENKKLKEQRRELKNKLEAKEAEYLECKNECDNNDEIITGLGKDKFELENKVRQLKSDRKRLETQIKEKEDHAHEIERTYKEKLDENNEEIRKMKVNFEKLDQQIKSAEIDKFWYKGWLYASLAIVVALLIANFYLLVNPFDNNWYFVASLGPAPQ